MLYACTVTAAQNAAHIEGAADVVEQCVDRLRETWRLRKLKWFGADSAFMDHDNGRTATRTVGRWRVGVRPGEAKATGVTAALPGLDQLHDRCLASVIMEWLVGCIKKEDFARI